MLETPVYWDTTVNRWVHIGGVVVPPEVAIHLTPNGPVSRTPSPEPVPTKKPARVQILDEASRLTAGSRDKEYGPPAINLNCAGRLKAVIRECMTREISPAELEALDMVLTKISRVVTGTPKRDSYVDGAAYFAIAGEVSGAV